MVVVLVWWYGCVVDRRDGERRGRPVPGPAPHPHLPQARPAQRRKTMTINHNNTPRLLPAHLSRGLPLPPCLPACAACFLVAGGPRAGPDSGLPPPSRAGLRPAHPGTTHAAHALPAAFRPHPHQHTAARPGSRRGSQRRVRRQEATVRPLTDACMRDPTVLMPPHSTPSLLPAVMHACSTPAAPSAPQQQQPPPLPSAPRHHAQPSSSPLQQQPKRTYRIEMYVNQVSLRHGPSTGWHEA